MRCPECGVPLVAPWTCMIPAHTKRMKQAMEKRTDPIEVFLDSPEVPFWAQKTMRDVLGRDPVDAINWLTCIVALLKVKEEKHINRLHARNLGMLKRLIEELEEMN